MFQNQSETITGNAAPNIGAQATAGASLGVNNAAPSSAISFKQIIMASEMPSQLLENGKKYLETLEVELKRMYPGVEFIPVNTDKFSCRIIKNTEGSAISIVLEETYKNVIEDVPVTAVAPEIIRKRLAEFGVREYLMNFTVTERDYNRAEIMAATIKRYFTARSGFGPVTFESIASRDIKYVCYTDMARVRQYVDMWSPHSTPARDDIGFLVCANVKSEIANQPDEQIPILAVTGYTKFIFANPAISPGKYNAFVTISNIVTQFPCPQMLALAIPLAANTFITLGEWLKPYSSFGPAGTVNLGNLVLDQKTGKPFRCENLQSRSGIITNSIAALYLGIDVTDGRARIPGIEKFIETADTNVINAALDCIGKFLNSPIANRNMIIAKTLEYTGEVCDSNSNVIDSRKVDYLNLVARINDYGRASEFLQQPNEPGARQRQIREFYTDYKSLYANTTAIFSCEFLNELITKTYALKIMYPQGNMNMNTGFYDLPNRPYQLVQANPNYNTPYFGPGTYGNVIR